MQYTRLATEKEKQLLLGALHKEGKDWDAEKKEIVDVYQPQDGDFVTWDGNGIIAICKDQLVYKGNGMCEFNEYAHYDRFREELVFGASCVTSAVRPATEEEKKLLLYEFHKANTDWDAEKKDFVPYEWHPEEGMPYWIVSSSGVPQLINNYIKKNFEDETTIGNCFPTIDAARPYAEKFKELFKE